MFLGNGERNKYKKLKKKNFVFLEIEIDIM